MSTGYYLADPTGNITLLAVKPDCREYLSALPQMAAALMAQEPSAEQVGFLSAGTQGTDISLTMAGGEFCGNAALSAAAVSLLEKEQTFPMDEKTSVLVDVYGTEKPVEVCIRCTGEKTFEGTVSMPPAISVETKHFRINGSEYRMPAVSFQGITHLICAPSDGILFRDRALAEKAVVRWCGEMETEAMGIMFLDAEKDTLLPLVYVSSAKTLFWENSCASGTSAAGVYLAEKNGESIKRSFREPAGLLTVEATADGKVSFSGTVVIRKTP